MCSPHPTTSAIAGTRVSRYAMLAFAISLASAAGIVQADDFAGGPSDEDIQVAAQAYDEGQQQFLRGEYQRAASSFLVAYDRAPTAEALLQAGRAYEQAGQPAKAADSALAVQRDHPDHEQATEFADVMLDRLAPTLARIDIQCDDCQVTVDDVPSSTSFFLDAERRATIRVIRPNGVIERAVRARRGKRSRWTIDRAYPGPPWERVAAVEQPDMPDHRAPSGTGALPETTRPFGQDGAIGGGADMKTGPAGQPQATGGGVPRWLTLGAIGVSGALVATSLALTVDAMSGVDPYETAAAELRACTSDCGALESRTRVLLQAGQDKESLVTAAWVATGVAVVGTAALALLWTDWNGDADDARAGPQLSVQMSPQGPEHGGLVTWYGSF